jgi:[ribosomal protein S5]-alanine N-acetyltransferase
MLRLEGELCRLRPYRRGDEAAICAVANDFMVARWMTQRFPHPYARRDADDWVEQAVNDSRTRHFAIEVDGRLAGGVGFEPLEGERGGTATFGYWLGREFWGRGIATDAARTLSAHVFADTGIRRLEASVFAPNVASAKVLEKCGFVLEATLRSFFLERDGAVCDALLYVKLARVTP